MSFFINDSFLLDNKSAEVLYHEYAANMPIIDHHCHISPREMAQDISWENITQVWLYGDHYKWRAMRANGINERYCTGDASDREKFDQYAATIPYLLRNPLYHWSHLELCRYFGINDLLSPQTADYIWDKTCDILQHDFSAQRCLAQRGVEVLCTTDDPIDDLSWHKQYAENKNSTVRMLPTWRPDKALLIEQPLHFNAYLDQLEECSGRSIGTYSDLLEVLQDRHDYFASCGCKISDYGVERIPFAPCSLSVLEQIFAKARSGKQILLGEADSFKSALLLDCARMDARKGWARQLHLGGARNNNSRMFSKVGPDSGFDSMDDRAYAHELSKHLDTLDSEGLLGKTILYNLAPKDNEMLACLLGNFQDGDIPGKMQLGSAWWFSDQMDGIERQLEAVSQFGLLRRFVGMLTDSRSFLSYSRHEYFRRILCNKLGKDMDKGYIPHDYNLVGKMVQDISYHNSKEYFGL